jgi:subtilisin family serine protease
MRKSINLIILAIAGFSLHGCAWLQQKDLAPPNVARQILITIAVENQQSATLMGYQASGSVAIQNKPSTARKNAEKIAESIARKHRLKIVGMWPIAALGVECVVLEVADNRTTEQVLFELRSEKQIESLQNVSSYKLMAYNDPYFHLQNTVSIDGLEQVHELATGKGVVVGIIDTGLDSTHPELASKIIYKNNFVAHDQRMFDGDPHGTAVAGVIAATANNDVGIVGVAPDVKLVALKACWYEPQARVSRCDSFSLIKALVKTLELDPDILNLSLTGPPDALIAKLIQKASQQGMIIVSAVDPSAGAKNSFPANMREVISVVAPPVVQAHSSLSQSFLAPGIDILTTAPEAGYAFWPPLMYLGLRL